MSINRLWVPAIVISVLLGSVFGSQVFGWWSISGRGAVNLDDLAPADLKGWMTLQEVADGLGLTLEEVYQVGGIPAEIAPDTALKDMEDVVEVSTLRIRLAEYLASGFTPSAPDENAATLVPDDGAPSDNAGGLGIGDGNGAGSGNGRTPLPPGEILPADQIEGRMTLREVSEQCGVTLDDLLAALNLAPDIDLDVSLKALTQDGSLDEVSTVKDAVATLQQANRAADGR